MAELTMGSITSTVGELITSLISWAGSVLTFITGNPLLLFFILVFTVGGGVIGIVHRLIRG